MSAPPDLKRGWGYCVCSPGPCNTLAWGYQHKTVRHGRGKYARDEDGAGFCEVHVNTMEGFGLF